MKRVILGLSVLIGAASAACASVTAKTAPERPPLEVPAPPTKVVEPSPRPEPITEPVPELPPAQIPNSRPPRSAVREPARTDPKPEATTPTETPAPAAAPAAAPQLRPGGTPDASEAAKQAQSAIERANKALNSLNSKQLAKTKRPVYDDAVRVLKSANDAFGKSDFDNAKKLAEKVESTARELGAR
jgi:outer membrane biosynthesis protein TonB